MPIPVIYPKVSLEEATGSISRWLVAEGDSVTAGQVIFEIENDKAAVEVEAPAAGRMGGMKPEGTEVDVGATVAWVLAEGESLEAPAPAAAPAAAAQPASASVAAAAAAPAVAAREGRGPNPTPLARRIARENGVELDGLSGTGPRGRVQKKDVLALIAAQGAGTAPAAAVGALIAAPRALPPSDAKGDLHHVWLRKGEGTPLVLIHGFSANADNWRGMLFGQKPNFPVLAIELPGHGNSPRSVPATLDALAAEIEATLASLGVGTCSMGGHSFGGAAAARIAARGVIEVKGLALFSPAGLGSQINAPFTQGILQARSRDALKPWLELLAYDPAVISPPFLAATEAARQDEGLTNAMTVFADTFFPDGHQAFSVREDLARITAPVRVIFGRQDRILPFESTRGLPGNVGLHGFDRCGHMPHLEHAAASFALLNELVRSAS